MQNRIKHIELVPYNPKWPGIYKVEANIIKQTITNNIVNSSWIEG